MTFQSDDKTLAEEDIENIREKIIASVKNHVGGKLAEK
jgi:phenylalanyl-tRNA synthetase beta subunit